MPPMNQALDLALCTKEVSGVLSAQTSEMIETVFSFFATF